MVSTKNVYKLWEGKRETIHLGGPAECISPQKRKSVSVLACIAIVEDTKLKKKIKIIILKVYSWRHFVMSFHRITHKIQWIQNVFFL